MTKNPSPLDGSVRRAFTALCWEVATPVAYKAFLALQREDWLQLTTIKVDISRYHNVLTLSGDLQIAAFFKKFPDFDLGKDLVAEAVDSFWASERQCYLANERLAPLIHDRKVYGEGVSKIISSMRKKVAKILGACPKWTDIEGSFGPGSTYEDVGPLITVPDKMSNSYTLTRGAIVTMEAWDKTAWSRYAASGLVLKRDIGEGIETLSQYPANMHPVKDTLDHGGFELGIDPFCEYNVRTEKFVRGNRFTTVDKDAHKRRGICIEPSINLFFQLGIGRKIARRMGMCLGWYKSTQQEFHRLLARLGSLTGLSATIDLSSASDTVCRMLVKLLLPKKWFELLDSIRSPFTFVDGKWVRLEKFSSMGNGFTFELETLLFRVITEVACEGSSSGDFLSGIISTFGDDIICPADKADNVVALLGFLGFKTNGNKTFLKGKFRESCGGDFFMGKDVRPHYLKENPDEPHKFVALANGLRRFGIRHILCGGPHLYRKPWLRILDAIPSAIRNCRGPEALGDIVVHDEEERWRYTVRESRRYFRCWRPVTFGRTNWSHFRPGVVLASALYGVGDGRTGSVLNDRLVEPSSGKNYIDVSGVLTRVNGEYVRGHRFGRVQFS